MSTARALIPCALVTAVAVALALTGCGPTSATGSTTTPAPTAASVSPAAVPASSPSPSEAAPAPTSTSAPSTASARSGAGGAATAPAAFGTDVCTLLPSSTVDSTLGVHVTYHGWDGRVCTWVSSKGGATIGWIAPGSPQLRETTAATGSTVPGLGVRNVGRVQTGLPAPLPATQAFLIVDLGHGGMTVSVSGPKVTLDEAAVLARDVIGG